MRSSLLALPVGLCFVVLAAGCPEKVDSVAVSPANVTLRSESDTKTLVATVLSEGGEPLEDKTVTWTSSNTAVATVGASDGIVKPVGSGKAIITAAVEEASATARVEVRLLKGIKLAAPAVVVKAGASNPPLTVAFSNEKGELIEVEGAKLEWSSADPNIATVGADGAVRGVAPGSTTISVRIDGLSDDVAVTVTAADPTVEEASAEPGASTP